MKQNAFLTIAIGLLLGILGVIAYKVSPDLRNEADVMLPVSTCQPDLQTCVVTLPDGRPLGFSVGPHPIKALQNLQLDVNVGGIGIQNVEVDFNGADMDMGYNRVKLSGTPPRFSGRAMLPVCVTGTMKWNATVLLSAGSQRIAVPFQFTVAGP